MGMASARHDTASAWLQHGMKRLQHGMARLQHGTASARHEFNMAWLQHAGGEEASEKATRIRSIPVLVPTRPVSSNIQNVGSSVYGTKCLNRGE